VASTLHCKCAINVFYHISGCISLYIRRPEQISRRLYLQQVFADSLRPCNGLAPIAPCYGASEIVGFIIIIIIIVVVS